MYYNPYNYNNIYTPYSLATSNESTTTGYNVRTTNVNNVK